MASTYDPQAAAHALAKADKPLGRVIRKAGPFRLSPLKIQSPFEALLRAIVYQQLSGKAAATIYGRVEALVPGRGGPKPADLLQLRDEQLRGAGMSRAKTAAVKDLAAKAVDGVVPTLAQLRRMSDEAIIERLITIRGIGVWSVEMLLFRMGRPDVLPVSDLGIRKGMQLVYELAEMPAPKAVLAHGERWRPYRSVASWYLWRAVEILPFADLKTAPKAAVRRSCS